MPSVPRQFESRSSWKAPTRLHNGECPRVPLQLTKLFIFVHDLITSWEDTVGMDSCPCLNSQKQELIKPFSQGDRAFWQGRQSCYPGLAPLSLVCLLRWPALMLGLGRVGRRMEHCLRATTSKGVRDQKCSSYPVIFGWTFLFHRPKYSLNTTCNINIRMWLVGKGN